MKKTTFLLLMVSLVPSIVLAWNTPGDDFSGELKLGGAVTNTRNPWVWKTGSGNDGQDVSLLSLRRSGERTTPVSLSAMTVLSGKTTLVTPAGREGLSPRVTYGKEVNGFKLEWTEPGTATVTLPVTGDDNRHAGSFTFRIQAAAVMRYVRNGQTGYVSLYEDMKGNGLPEQTAVMPAEQVPAKLQAMTGGDAPAWLQKISVSETAGLSRFSDISLHQLEGVYGAQVIPDSGELHLIGEIPSRWHVSLPVSIEYQ